MPLLLAEKYGFINEIGHNLLKVKEKLELWYNVGDLFVLCTVEVYYERKLICTRKQVSQYV